MTSKATCPSCTRLSSWTFFSLVLLEGMLAEQSGGVTGGVASKSKHGPQQRPCRALYWRARPAGGCARRRSRRTVRWSGSVPSLPAHRRELLCGTPQGGRRASRAIGQLPDGRPGASMRPGCPVAATPGPSNRHTLAMKSLQKMDFRRNNCEHHPRSIIPAWLPPPGYFLKIARAAGRRFRLIRIRRMNRLSGGLFGVPSHICTTSIESGTRGGGIERD